ncbi:MAG: metal-sensing transcriptional repressor [Ruminococcaceae bacterium]|nr:metal-sensing transcriptional repressor [Oscillospiraceae bacterium]
MKNKNIKAECQNCKKKERLPEEKKKLQNRLNRIEGQVRGLSKMVDDDAYCIDILVQIQAAKSALAAVSRVLLESHMRSCVTKEIKEGNEDEVLDDLMRTIEKMLK